jgi:hypothetical protein
MFNTNTVKIYLELFKDEFHKQYTCMVQISIPFLTSFKFITQIHLYAFLLHNDYCKKKPKNMYLCSYKSHLFY